MAVMGLHFIDEPFAKQVVANGYYHPLRYNALVRALAEDFPTVYQSLVVFQQAVTRWFVEKNMGFLKSEEEQAWEKFVAKHEYKAFLEKLTYMPFPMESYVVSYAGHLARDKPEKIRELLKLNVVVRIRKKTEDEGWHDDDESYACLVAGLDCFPEFEPRVRAEMDAEYARVKEYNSRPGRTSRSYHMLLHFTEANEDLGYDRLNMYHHNLRMTESEFINQGDELTIPCSRSVIPSTGPYPEVMRLNFEHFVPGPVLSAEELSAFKERWLQTYNEECGKINRTPNKKMVEHIQDF